MGTCFGQLKGIIRKRKRRLLQLEHSHYNKNEDRVELHFLVEEEESHPQDTKTEETIFKSKKLYKRICSFLKPKCYEHLRGGGEEEPEGWEAEEEDDLPSPSPGVVSEDVQLVTLDVRSLRCVQSPWHIATPPSSVDLEWEHDGAVGNISTVCQRRLLSTTEELSSSSAAMGSPAESLEWDSCEGGLDTDTEQLLCEIERLTARALRETGGDWANR